MDSTLKNTVMPSSPELVDHIVSEVKSQGIFDQFRKECIADVDTKPAYQNLRTRVENSVNSFLSKQMWKPDINKNQLREALRKQMLDSSYLDAGVERIVDQVVNPKIYSIFMPQIEDVVYKFLGLEKPSDNNNGSCEFKDLLPVDLDPVSPESDKNSLKDVSLDSADANIEKLDTGEAKLVPPGVEEHGDSMNHETSLNLDNDNNGHVKKSNKFDIGSKKMSALEMEPNIIISSFLTLNTSEKSNEKSEDDEDESPPFEPIESLNFNESNVSNESHLSGISGLTSHRSRSSNFSNDFSTDNVDFSNYETQFSKFSSDSRLSIVTNCGSSNQESTSMSNNSRDENKKEKIMPTDNFIAIRDRMTENINDNNHLKNNMLKENILEPADNVNSQDFKISSSFNESSSDGTDDKKNESESAEKHKSCHSSKLKSVIEKSASREPTHKTNRKKSSHNESLSDIYSELEVIEKHESSIDKLKDDRLQEENEKETKSLKNFYKEKIRELREKKDLTEKEKITNDSNHINIDKIRSGDFSTEIEKSNSKKHYRSSLKTRSSSHDSKSLKSLLKGNLKNKKTETKEKSKHNERRLSFKNHKSWSSTESSERPDSKKSLKNEKQKKSKYAGKDSYAKNSAKDGEIRREKLDTESKDKKRKNDKKTKSKDNYCSPRNNSSNRHSSDRDGSNGSNGKNCEKSNSCLNYSSSGQAEFSNVSNESSNTGNSSNETSDNNKISQMGFLQAPKEKYSVDNTRRENVSPKIINDGQNKVSLPLKKRALQSDENLFIYDNTIKKPKFEKKFQEAKKLIKIKKNIEKSERERSFQSPVKNLPEKNDVGTISDKERCQIIHIQNEDEAEPYPDNQTNLLSNELSKIIIAVNEITPNEAINRKSNQKSRLSTVELSVRQSMNEMISGDSLQEIELTDAENSLMSVLNQEEGEKKLADNCVSIEISKDISESKSIFKLKVSKKNCTDDRQKLFETSSSLSKHVRVPDNFSSTKKIEFSDDEDDCLYFVKDNEPLNKFTKFLKSLDPEQILKNKIVENGFTMAPPQVKQKYSTSPLSDILLNNSNNNDASDFKVSGDDEEVISPTKKKQTGRPKKQRLSITSHTSQHSMDGENFIMPPSPESDVSATSDKTLNANTLRDEKNRLRGSNQRYTSDDLYKPRPLFASSSRRSRRSNQT